MTKDATENLTAAHARRDAIARAATDVFIRYGYARTTMGDLAAAAGIARPTLYLSFPHKKDVFGAVIGLLVTQHLDRIRTALPDLPDLGTRLRHACLSWGLAGFDLVRTNPDARDLFDLNFAPVRDGHAAFIALLTDILAEAGRPDPAGTATMVAAALKGFKLVADTRDDVEAMVLALCDAVAGQGGA